MLASELAALARMHPYQQDDTENIDKLLRRPCHSGIDAVIRSAAEVAKQREEGAKRAALEKVVKAKEAERALKAAADSHAADVAKQKQAEEKAARQAESAALAKRQAEEATQTALEQAAKAKEAERSLQAAVASDAIDEDKRREAETQAAKRAKSAALAKQKAEEAARIAREAKNAKRAQDAAVASRAADIEKQRKAKKEAEKRAECAAQARSQAEAKAKKAKKQRSAMEASAPKRIKLTVPGSDTELALRKAADPVRQMANAALNLPATASVDDTEAALKALATKSALETTSRAATDSGRSTKAALRKAAPELAIALESRICKARGEAFEKAGLDKAGARAETGLKRRGECRITPLCEIEFQGELWHLSLKGMIDAFDEASGEVVEHKQRRNRLFKRVREYERVQVEAYMRLCNCSSGRLVESYDDSQAEHRITRCDAFWDTIVSAVKSNLLKRVIEPYYRAFEIIETSA